MSPSVAIILINWNGYEFTSQCLRSLRGLTYEQYQVIVVDNASTDGSFDALKDEFRDAVFLQNNSNLGFAEGNNVGMRYAVAQGFSFICLLNNDTEVEPDFLTQLMEAIDEKPAIGAVQPKILYNQQRKIIWNAGGIFNPWLGTSSTIGVNQLDTGKYNEQRTVDWITGCCILLPCDTLKEIGLLNKEFFAYFEDVDWSFRIKARGKSLIYVPDSIIYHEAGMSTKAKLKGKEGYVSPLVHYLNIRNQFFILRLYSKGVYFPSAWAFQCFKVFAHLIYFAVRGRVEKFKSVLTGVMHGLVKPLKQQNIL